ncbi:MAG: AMP-binding protein, partial [Planctomycetota bacterium]
MNDKNQSTIVDNGDASVQSGTEVKTTLELFQQVVHDCPHADAVVFEDRELSYSELSQLADQFAATLVQRGVQPGECVGLSIDRCPEAIAAMLGAFRVGAVFVPLDPEYPLERIQFMIEDAGIRVVITHDKPTNPLAIRMDESLELEWVDSCSIEFAEIDLQSVLAEREYSLPNLNAGDLA